MKRLFLVIMAGAVWAGCGLAGDLVFSDPDCQAAPPVDAVGYPSRDPLLDVLPGFIKPPPGYGQTPFYWWGGAKLEKDRLAWQLDQLKAAGIWGVMIAYPHSNDHKINNTWFGDTIESDPKVFSPAWWELYRWTAGECRKRDMVIGMVDYTMGFPGQGYWVDKMLREHPEINGTNLKGTVHRIEGGRELSLAIPGDIQNATAWQIKDDKPDLATAVCLRSFIRDGSLHWTAPAGGTWQVAVVWSQMRKPSLDPISPELGRLMLKEYYQPFEDNLPGLMGRGMNIFDHDEEGLFWIGGALWSSRFNEEFQKRKGYDLLPELPAIFTEFGPRTPKVRLDYWDVLVSLTEEGYFKPIFEWINQRGMLHPIDNLGRGLIPTEFGDYFRCVRWTTAPGCDQPALSFNLIKNKVGSSMGHLYRRPRTWVEGNYGCGWGVTPATLLRVMNQHFAVGMNMYSLHGCYYDTHGGWWEWAPPCFHFRMPYWRHAGPWMRYIERLSYLMSQGDHRCDVALLYPVEPGQAAAERSEDLTVQKGETTVWHESKGGVEKNKAARPAFELAKAMAMLGLDFDFIDFESVARATMADRQLKVSGEAYRVLVLPCSRELRFSTLQQALAFYRAGGMVVAFGALPEASDRIGRNDPELDAMVRELFGLTAAESASAKMPHLQKNNAGGVALFAKEQADVIAAVNENITRDFICPVPENPAIGSYVTHRRVGPRDVYLVNGIEKGTECFFRAGGRVELWDAWTGTTRPLVEARPVPGGMRVKLPLEMHEAQLIVFSPGDRVVQVSGETTKVPRSLTIDGDWDFELVPTMDNRWGDFRLPASPEMIGAEARKFRYMDEKNSGADLSAPGLDDSKWATVTASFGRQFWKLGPLPEEADVKALDEMLAGVKRIEPDVPVELNGVKYFWTPYEFSWRWGVEGRPGNQGYHGLKARFTDDFISLGQVKSSIHDFDKHTAEKGGTRYYLWTSVCSAKALEARLCVGGQAPAGMWVNGMPLGVAAKSASLKAGSNPVLLRYDAIGRAHVVFEDPAVAPGEWTQPCRVAMAWFNKPSVLPFDSAPWVEKPAGWYRFKAPPALQSMKIVARGAVRAWADGRPLEVRKDETQANGNSVYTALVANPAAGCVTVALRIEPDRGSQGGAALPEPVVLNCGKGRLAAGDWSAIDGLLCYSGAAWYRRDITLTQEQLQGQVLLDLGAVAATAELLVNGKAAGVKVQSPWQWDVSAYVQPGANRIEVLVCNTLANHYVTIPTMYRGSTLSGLLGPVSLVTRPVTVLGE